MSTRGIPIDPPVTGPVFEEFVAARDVWPWPHVLTGDVRAKRLYDEYVAFAEANGLTVQGKVRRVSDSDEPLLSSRDFGIALQVAGFEPDRDTDGRFYRSLLELPRDALARKDAIDIVTRDEHLRLWEEAQEAHDAVTDHGTQRQPVLSPGTGLQERDLKTGDLLWEDVPMHCTHEPKDIGPDVPARLAEYAAAHEDEVAEVIEERYGPFLRRDAAEIKAWREARAHRVRAAREAELAAVQAELAEARAKDERWRVRQLEARENDLWEVLHRDD